MQVLCGPQRAAGTEPPAVPPTVVERGERVIAGPAMGTTYRITLASPVPGMSRGEVHREMEAVLARIDAAASTWRPDSDVSLFNRSPAGEWVPISTDLATLVEIARIAHDETNGCFDITVGPLLDLWSNAEQSGTKPPQAAIDAAMAKVGMAALELRHTPSGTRELRKTRTGLTVTLSGIGPVTLSSLVARREPGARGLTDVRGNSASCGSPMTQPMASRHR
jgi:thiamine biosynthesis lipoprotein